jgi:hypothetical protein
MLAPPRAERGAGVSAEATLPRLAGTLAREGALGAAMGLGQGTSEVALQQGEISLGEAAHHLAVAAGKGAGIGAALGGATWGLGTAGRRVRDRYALRVGEIKQLRTERGALQAEMESLAAGGASEAQLVAAQNQLANVSTKLNELQARAVGKMFTRALAYGVGHAVGGGITGGLLGVVIAPKLLSGLRGALREHGGKMVGALKAKAAPLAPYWEAAVPVVRGAMESPAIRGAVEKGAARVASAAGGAVGKVAGTSAGHMATEAVGHGLGTGIGALAAGDLVAGGMMAGGVTGAAYGQSAEPQSGFGGSSAIRTTAPSSACHARPFRHSPFA